MDQYFPDLVSIRYREPFLGGGSVAIHITKTYPRLKIWVNDLYEPLVNWKVLQAEGLSLTDALIEQKVKHLIESRKLLPKQRIINDHEYTNVERAVAFYIVNNVHSVDLKKHHHSLIKQ